MLLPVELERFGRTGQPTDLRIPESFAGLRIPGLDVWRVAQKEQTSGGREQAGAAAVEFLAPNDVAGFVVDRNETRSPCQVSAPARASQAHRPARIRLHQIADAHRVLLVDVKQPGV